MADTVFVDEPCEVRIKRGVAYFIWPDGERRAVPLDVFRVNLNRMQKVLAEFDAKRGVVKLRSAPPKHG